MSVFQITGYAVDSNSQETWLGSIFLEVGTEEKAHQEAMKELWDGSQSKANCSPRLEIKLIVPPAGYAFIHAGLRQGDDMRWSYFDQLWSFVFSDGMSERIEELGFPCARRICN